MPNHVHVLIQTQPPHQERRHLAGYSSLAATVHSWKSFTAKAINQVLVRNGPVWQREYYDRYIRDDRHLAAVIGYIHENPVKAGLVTDAVLWPFGSARFLM